MSQDEEHSGIPTRAIHESYLDMQLAWKQFRTAKEDQNGIGEAHSEVQQAVITFYELLRPHIRHEDGVNDWWDGELPRYKSDGTPPDPDDGKGILQVQQNSDSFEFDPEQAKNINSLEGWHDALEFNGNRRIKGIHGIGDGVFVTWDEYQMGLRHIDNWETSYKRHVIQKEGFMSDKKEVKIEKQRIPIDRLKRASRELAAVSDRLGALSEFDASTTHTEITDEQIARVRKWQEENLQ